MVLLRNQHIHPGAGAPRTILPQGWLRESCIITTHATHAEHAPQVLPLSIRAAWGGTDRVFVDDRTIAVDDDGYLILNAQHECSSLIQSDRPVHALAIFFEPGFAEEVLGGLITPLDHALARGPESLRRPLEFSEHLHPHDHIVTPVLNYIARTAEDGIDDEMWYAEQLTFLLERMLRSHREVVAAVQRLSPARNATRREIHRRIGLATDFIHANYTRRLKVSTLAEAAHLSKFHFVRLFHAVHGTTPYAFLQAKRAHAARRLLQATNAPLDEIAVRVGFENRVSLFRHLRRVTGQSGRMLRQHSVSSTAEVAQHR